MPGVDGCLMVRLLSAAGVLADVRFILGGGGTVGGA